MSFDAEAYRKFNEDIQRDLAPLFARLPENYPRSMISIGRGWWHIVAHLDRSLSKIDPEYRVLQIKEKFGTGRFYVQQSEAYRENAPSDMSVDPFWITVADAERRTHSVCEECGAPGRQRNGGWVITLCDDCDDSLKEKR